MTYALFVPLVVFVIYRRVRRNFGRQPLRSTRLAITVAIFAIIAVLLLASAVVGMETGSLLRMGSAAGLLGGAALGLYGLHLTRIENTPQGRFYTPNSYIGMGLTALLLGRLVYRFAVLMPMMGAAAAQATAGYDANTMSALQRSPLTLAIVGLLVGYYLAYYCGLLWRAHGPASTRAPQ